MMGARKLWAYVVQSDIHTDSNILAIMDKYREEGVVEMIMFQGGGFWFCFVNFFLRFFFLPLFLFLGVFSVSCLVLIFKFLSPYHSLPSSLSLSLSLSLSYPHTQTFASFRRPFSRELPNLGGGSPSLHRFRLLHRI